jgi:hypothetical protein
MERSSQGVISRLNDNVGSGHHKVRTEAEGRTALRAFFDDDSRLIDSQQLAQSGKFFPEL